MLVLVFLLREKMRGSEKGDCHVFFLFAKGRVDRRGSINFFSCQIHSCRFIQKQRVVGIFKIIFLCLPKICYIGILGEGIDFFLSQGDQKVQRKY